MVADFHKEQSFPIIAWMMKKKGPLLDLMWQQIMEKNLIPILESENSHPWGTLIGITNTCTRFLVAQYFKTIKGVGLLIPQFVQLIRLSRCHKDVTKEWNKQCIYIFDMILTESTSTRKCHFVTYMEGTKEAVYLLKLPLVGMQTNSKGISCL